MAHYPLIKQCNQQRKHFMWGFIEDMNNRLHTDIRLTEFRPDLHMSEQEIARPLIEPPYWVFLSGGKTDFRTKIWSRKYWQEVIASTKNDINWVQCGGGSKNHVMHERIDGVHSYMVKRTKLRDFIRLIYHADGVVCVVTAAMHIAAAFNKPCVVIAGGREPWWWEAYTNENRLVNMRIKNPHWQIPANDDYVEHAFLHTMNKLPCCQNKGCWKAKLDKSISRCKNIMEIAGQKLPKCKAMITPEMVIESVFKYYKGGAITRSKLSSPGKELSATFGIYPKGDSTWEKKIRETLSEDAKVVVSTNPDRLAAIKEALREVSDWFFWLEPDAIPASRQWLRFIKSRLSDKAIKGRIYRTKDGRLYPHPGCFIGPSKLLDKEAESYVGLFGKLNRTEFLPLGDEIQLAARRPCLALSGESSDTTL